MIPTPAEEWRSASHKTITTPSGRIAIIRKVRRLDFYPLDLLEELSSSDAPLSETVDAYFRRNPQGLAPAERHVLAMGIVDPQVSAEPTEGKLYADDIDAADREFLLSEIGEWSGMKG